MTPTIRLDALYQRLPNREASEADGFLFQSRFTGHECVAAVRKLAVLDVAPLLQRTGFLQALSDCDMVAPPR